MASIWGIKRDNRVTLSIEPVTKKSRQSGSLITLVREKLNHLEKQIAVPRVLFSRFCEVKLGIVLVDEGRVIRTQKMGLLKEQDVNL